MRSDNGPEFTAAVSPKQLTKVGTNQFVFPPVRCGRTDIMRDLMEHLGERF